jgi:peptide/nickel transport system substrate-binding protein
MNRTLPRRVGAAVTAAIAVALLAACTPGTTSATPIRVGWSGELPPLDPAASDSAGSFAFLSQVYPSLLAVRAGETDPVPSVAESAEWTAPGVFTVVLPDGLEFANGNALTTSDVRFSIERQLGLQSADGAWRRLEGIDTVQVVDDTTIEFRVPTDVDTRLPYVLAGPAGLVLDEETFFADELTPDEDILDAEAFAGPYSLTATRDGTYVLTPNPDYGGTRSALAAVEIRQGDGQALADQLRGGSLDVINGRLEAEALEVLADDDALEQSTASSGRVRMLAFDLTRMPFGSRAEGADEVKAAAVRVAIADLIDRDALVDVGDGLVDALSGYLPNGLPGSDDVLSARYGDLEGGPDAAKAEAGLVAAGIVEPVALTIHVDLDQVGDPGSVEVATLAGQLEDSGLFVVDVIETDAEGLGDARLAGEVQAAFTSLLPADIDPQDYLAMFGSTSTAFPGFGNADLDGLLAGMVTQVDPDARAAALVQAQNIVAGLLPAIPVTQGVRVVFANEMIAGTDLDDSFALDLSRLRR